MMRASHQPLAHLVDAAAEKWLAAEHASEREQRIARDDITQAFRIGDKSELTFHGLRYLLTILRSEDEDSGLPQEFRIKVHEIALNT